MPISGDWLLDLATFSRRGSARRRLPFGTLNAPMCSLPEIGVQIPAEQFAALSDDLGANWHQRSKMLPKANLRIETKLCNPMEPICIHVCADDKLVGIVSLQDFDSACETLHRIRHNRFVNEDGKADPT